MDEAYTNGATAGALYQQLPIEIGMRIGFFLGRLEGAQLAKTCKQAAEMAREEAATVAKKVGLKF